MPNFTAVETYRSGAWRLKQQGESIGVMKIRFAGRMAKRPVREPIARLDDRREPDTEGSTRVDGRQAIELDNARRAQAGRQWSARQCAGASFRRRAGPPLR